MHDRVASSSSWACIRWRPPETAGRSKQGQVARMRPAAPELRRGVASTPTHLGYPYIPTAVRLWPSSACICNGNNTTVRFDRSSTTKSSYMETIVGEIELRRMCSASMVRGAAEREREDINSSMSFSITRTLERAVVAGAARSVWAGHRS